MHANNWVSLLIAIASGKLNLLVTVGIIIWFVFLRGSYGIVRAGLKLKILLPRAPRCRNFRHVLTCLTTVETFSKKSFLKMEGLLSWVPLLVRKYWTLHEYQNWAIIYNSEKGTWSVHFSYHASRLEYLQALVKSIGLNHKRKINQKTSWSMAIKTLKRIPKALISH